MTRGLCATTIEKIIEENPQSVEDYHNGKEKAIGFLGWTDHESDEGKSEPCDGKSDLKRTLIVYIRRKNKKKNGRSDRNRKKLPACPIFFSILSVDNAMVLCDNRKTGIGEKGYWMGIRCKYEKNEGIRKRAKNQ